MLIRSRDHGTWHAPTITAYEDSERELRNVLNSGSVPHAKARGKLLRLVAVGSGDS
ncbi:MAG TPA: hypothetical protein VGE81_05830 [Candidatus Limnocylindrales bacterium]|jgi:hypothetical protein